MRDLVVCVGESCHLSGAEVVVKTFIDAVATQELQEHVLVKGCFCIGECGEDGQVSVKFEDVVSRIGRDDAETYFESTVLPACRGE